MTIAEVCKKYELTPDTLRYYERIGLIPGVRRTAGGIRDYSEYDLGWIEFIKCMRGAGVEIEALLEYVTLFEQGDSTAEARKQILIDQRDRIAARVSDMQETLGRLDKKIEMYEEHVMQAEEDLRAASLAKV